jgi:hypothetical protein
MTRNRNIRSGIRHMFAAMLFCFVMSMGIVCFADEQGTVNVASAKIRATADSSSEQLGSVEQGGTVDIIGQTTGTDGKTWYQVYVDANTKGYIRADLVKTSSSANIPTVSATTAAAASTDQSVTTATSVESKKGTVSTNNVRIRKGASTNHDVVATANRGMVVTVTGEADGSDGNKWYQITFTYNSKEITGFIRSDLVTFDDVPADTAVSEITGEAGGEENTELQTEEEVEQDTQDTEQSDNDSSDIILMNVEEVPYIMPGFVAVDLNWNDEKINAYKNGNFYIFYAQMQNGDEGWYVFDSENIVYQRYVYTSSDATVPNGSTGSVGIIPVIILIVIIIILAAAVGLLLVKNREYTVYDDGYDDEEYPDDDIEDIDEIDEFEDEKSQYREMPKQPVRRPQPASSLQTQQQIRQTQPAGSMQGQRTAGGQVRRPQPQSGSSMQSQQPVRRPQPQSGNSMQGQQPVRRTQPGNNSQSQPQSAVRRQQMPNGSMQGQRTAGGQVRRPQSGNGVQQTAQRRPQSENAQAQQGYKAKNILENDDDMDFMDI